MELSGESGLLAYLADDMTPKLQHSNSAHNSARPGSASPALGRLRRASVCISSASSCAGCSPRAYEELIMMIVKEWIQSQISQIQIPSTLLHAWMGSTFRFAVSATRRARPGWPEGIGNTPDTPCHLSD